MIFCGEGCFSDYLFLGGGCFSFFNFNFKKCGIEVRLINVTQNKQNKIRDLKRKELSDLTLILTILRNSAEKKWKVDLCRKIEIKLAMF